MMFDRAWLENELAGLIVQLHQIEGAIATLRQMIQQLEEAEKASASTAGEMSLEQFQAMLPDGSLIEGIEKHEG